MRTEQIKRTAKELIKRFPDKFSNDFENNKHLVNSLVQGGTPKVLNQIAGYITRFVAAEQRQLQEETSEGVEPEGAESTEEAPEGA
ncbi:MAG: 30S ribosomal protein S17e [Candidatus Bathyarchaeia archaeon]